MITLTEKQFLKLQKKLNDASYRELVEIQGGERQVISEILGNYPQQAANYFKKNRGKVF